MKASCARQRIAARKINARHGAAPHIPFQLNGDLFDNVSRWHGQWTRPGCASGAVASGHAEHSFSELNSGGAGIDSGSSYRCDVAQLGLYEDMNLLFLLFGTAVGTGTASSDRSRCTTRRESCRGHVKPCPGLAGSSTCAWSLVASACSSGSLERRLGNARFRRSPEDTLAKGLAVVLPLRASWNCSSWIRTYDDTTPAKDAQRACPRQPFTAPQTAEVEQRSPGNQ